MSGSLESELKPCPWCGKKPEIEKIHDATLHYVTCRTSGCTDTSMVGATKAQACNAWNTRAGNTPVTPGEAKKVKRLQWFKEGDEIPGGAVYISADVNNASFTVTNARPRHYLYEVPCDQV